MTVYTVTVSRTVATDVRVVADTPEAAAEQVNRHSFPLPPVEEWQGLKDWRMEVLDANGETLLEVER